MRIPFLLPERNSCCTLSVHRIDLVMVHFDPTQPAHHHPLHPGHLSVWAERARWSVYLLVFLSHICKLSALPKIMLSAAARTELVDPDHPDSASSLSCPSYHLAVDCSAFSCFPQFGPGQKKMQRVLVAPPQYELCPFCFVYPPFCLDFPWFLLPPWDEDSGDLYRVELFSHKNGRVQITPDVRTHILSEYVA